MTNRRLNAAQHENFWNCLLASSQLWDVWQRELQLALSFVWSASHVDEKTHQSQNILHQQQ
jgi:hypothetical protein